MELGTLKAHGILCDYAEVVAGKLFVCGAGIGLVGTQKTDAPHPVNIALAILVRIPWGATNQQHRLTIELLSQTDQGPERVRINEILPPGTDEAELGKIIAVFNAGRAPHMVVGEETLLPVALPMPGVPLPRVGSYYFSIALDGTEVDQIPFRVSPVMNMPGGFVGPSMMG